MSERDPVTERVPVAAVTDLLSHVLADVQSGRRRLLVTEGSTAVAALISAGDYQRFLWMEADRASRFKALDSARATFADVPNDVIEREVAEAVAQVRRERGGSRPGGRQ